MGNQIERILKNLLKPENEKIKIRSEKKSKIDKKINQLIQKKKKQSGGGIGQTQASTGCTILQVRILS